MNISRNASWVPSTLNDNALRSHAQTSLLPLKMNSEKTDMSVSNGDG